MEERGHHAIFFTFKGRIIDGQIEIAFPEEIEEVIWMDAEEALKYAYIPSKVGVDINNISMIPYIIRGKVIHK